MWSFIKNRLFQIGAFILLSSFQNQGNFSLLNKDTVSSSSDSLQVKDTLLIKYVQVLPTSFQLTDAWFIQTQLGNKQDSNFNILKSYKNYFTQKKNAFKLYFPKNVMSHDDEVIFKIEQRFALPNKDLLFYGILFLLFLYGFETILSLNISPNYLISSASLL